MDIWGIAEDLKAERIGLQATQELLALGDQMANMLGTCAGAKATETSEFKSVALQWQAMRGTLRQAEERRLVI